MFLTSHVSQAPKLTHPFPTFSIRVKKATKAILVKSTADCQPLLSYGTYSEPHVSSLPRQKHLARIQAVQLVKRKTDSCNHQWAFYKLGDLSRFMWLQLD